jgi:hypothetical protein plarl_03105
MKVLFSNLSFGRVLDSVQDNPDTRGMRLPSWKEDVIIKCQMPDENSKMTAPYLYVESRFGRVPWKETMIEMFSKEWQLVDISKNDETKTECKVQNNDNLLEMLVNAAADATGVPREFLKGSFNSDKNKVAIEKVDKIHKIREQDNILNKKTLKEKNNEIHKERDKNVKSDNLLSITLEDVKEATQLYEHINGNCGGSQECKKRCLHECDKLKFKKMNDEKVRDDSIDSLTNLIMYLHWLGYDFF